MRHVVLLVALLLPTVALADVAPGGGGCKCDSGGPGGAVALVLLAAGLTRRR